MNQLRTLAVSVAAVMSAFAVQAASVQNTFGLVAPAVTITFDEESRVNGSDVTTYQSITLSPLLRYNSQGAAAFPGITGNYVGNNGGANVNPFSILFGGDITAAAFGVATNPATTFFEALDNGIVVESFAAATHFNGSTNYYFGFQGITFDEIRVTVGGDRQMLIDNVQIGAVPEPATYALLVAGLAAVAGVARRRQR